MRRMLWLVLIAAVAACGNDEGGATDPYAVIWVKNELDSTATDSLYRVLLVRVNQDSLISDVTGVGPGEHGCISYAGFADDSLDIQIWLAAVSAGDTLKTPTFMPLTGMTTDSAAQWGVFFRDSGVVLQENPPNFACIF